MRRRIRVAGSLAVPALLGLSLLAPTTAQAADVTSGDYKAVFNYTKPGSTTLDHSILNDLAGLVDRAAPGSTVYMGMYWFGLAELKAKILEAQDRGVTLRMVSEKRNEPSSTPFTAAELKNGSTWTWCTNSCLGNGPGDVNAISHDKYFVFTALDDGRKNVVWQSSQNIAVSQSGELNNALVVSNNAQLAARYIAHFDDQVKHAGDSLHTTYDHTTSDPGAPVEAFFFPRDTASDASHYGNADVVASFIDDVDCARGGRIRISAAELDERSSRPAVAVTGDGRIVAAWADEYTTGSGTVVREQRVYHRTFSATGAPAGAETRTTPDSADVPGDRPIGTQADPDVTVSDAGDFVVAWAEAFVDGLDDVWARGFNADGSTAGRLPARRMNVVSGGGQGGPAVTLAPDGRLSLTYSDDYDGNKFNEMRLRDAFANK
ncbi:hypothetical protein AB0N26_22400 [Streptomyces cellulosae]